MSQHVQVICQELLFPPTIESVSVSVAPINKSTTPLAKNHLRIRVMYGTLNFADVLQVGGKYQEKRDPPFIPGSELAGVIHEINGKTESYQVGDQVIMLAQKDGWQTFIDIPIQYPAIIKVPNTLDLHKAAGLLVAYSTSHVALTHERHGNLKKHSSSGNEKKQIVLVCF